MTWAEAIRDIAFAILGAAVVLGLYTDFWATVFNGTGVRKVEVLPQSLEADIQALVEEMRGSAHRYDARPITIRSWAEGLETALEKARDALDEDTLH
jgi:hypothetical protein